MSGKPTRTSRRSIIKAGALGAAALGGGIAISACKKGTGTAGVSPSGKKTLRIIQWNHFVPAFDKWFNGTYIKKWGEENDTEVTVDNVGIPALNPTAAAEVSSKNGHDLFGFLWPRPVYEEDAIDHTEIYQECEKTLRQADRSGGQEHLQPEDQEVLRFLRQLRPRPDQLAQGSVRRGRRDARTPGSRSGPSGRRSRTRPEFRSASAWPARSTPPWRCARSCIRSAAASRTPRATWSSTRSRRSRR